MLMEMGRHAHNIFHSQIQDKPARQSLRNDRGATSFQTAICNIFGGQGVQVLERCPIWDVNKN